MKYTLFLCLIQFFLLSKLNAQTGGLSYVESIEKKAKSILDNRDKIKKLERDILEIGNEWDKKTNSLKQEIKDLEEERDKLLADMKVGARCSECNRWKTEIEKSGKETFQQHLGSVKGYAIPASTSELEAVRVQYREKIAYKKVMLQNLEKQNPAVQKRKEIEGLKNTNESLCSGITADSKSYETTVFKNAKAKHKNWLNEIMYTIALQHIAQDGNTLYTLLSTNFTTKYNNTVATLKKRHQQEIENEKLRLKTEKLKLQKKQSDLLTVYNNNKSIKEKKIQLLQQNVAKLKLQLNSRINDSLKVIIQAQIDQEWAAITLLETEIKAMLDDFSKSNNRLKSDILDIDDELWKIQTNVSQLQVQHVQELATVRVQYEKAMDDIRYNLQRKDIEIKKLTDEVLSKRNDYKKANIIYVDEIVNESNRMFTAGQSVSCTIYNEIRFMVAQNYNKQESCVITFTAGGLGRSFPSSAVGCLAEYPSYVSKYKSFVNALSQEQREAIKASTFYSWYSAIMSN